MTTEIVARAYWDVPVDGAHVVVIEDDHNLRFPGHVDEHGRVAGRREMLALADLADVAGQPLNCVCGRVARTWPRGSIGSWDHLLSIKGQQHWPHRSQEKIEARRPWNAPPRAERPSPGTILSRALARLDETAREYLETAREYLFGSSTLADILDARRAQRWVETNGPVTTRAGTDVWLLSPPDVRGRCRALVPGRGGSLWESAVRVNGKGVATPIDRAPEPAERRGPRPAVALVGSLEAQSFQRAKDACGRWTRCRNSLKRHGSPPGNVRVEGPGWEPAHERTPRVGWEYAVKPGCSDDGGPGHAAWVYWLLVRRPLRVAS
jgi:hypothetical protein